MPATHRVFAGHAHPNPSTDEPAGHWLHSSPAGSKKYPLEHSELAATELGVSLAQSPTTCARRWGTGVRRREPWDVGFAGDTRVAPGAVVSTRGRAAAHRSWRRAGQTTTNG